MEDIEIIKTDSEILKETEQALQKLQIQQEIEKKSMTQEMFVLIEEMDNVLKQKSDQEYSFNSLKYKMERNLLEYQGKIDHLQSELKASERSVAKARSDLMIAQDQYITTEDKYNDLLNSVQQSKKESAQLTKKINELNSLIEQKNKKNNELQKLYTDERNKNDVNSYLNDYVEFLESQMQLEKKNKESIEFQEKVIEQLKIDHQTAVDSLKQKIEYQQKELEAQKAIIQKKEEINLQNSSTIAELQTKIISLNELKSQANSYQPQNFSTSSSINTEIKKVELNNNVENVQIDSDFKPNVSTGRKKLSLINDPSNNFMTCLAGLEDQLEKQKKEIESWENLFKTIDIDTYLTQVESQVDELHSKNIYESRNSVLKRQLDQTLRGIRQLCDYHNIDMEYQI